MSRPSIFIAIKNTTVQKPRLATEATRIAFECLRGSSVGLILLHSQCVPLFLLMCLTSQLCGFVFVGQFSCFKFVYFLKC